MARTVNIHHILTTQAYGTKVSRKGSGWGIFVGQNNVVDIDSGKICGWRDQPALRIRCRDAKGRQQTLLLAWSNLGAQAHFAGVL